MTKFVKCLKLAMLYKDAKKTMIIALVCFICGPIFLMTSNLSFAGAVLTVYPWMFLMQFMTMTEIAEATAASPIRKFAATTMCDIISFVGCIVSYLVITIIGNIKGFGSDALISFVFIGMFIIYFATVYRFYWASILIIIGLFVAMYSFFVLNVSKFATLDFNYPVLGGVVLLVCWLIGCICRRLTYKMPINPIMVRSLEKQVQK